MTTPHPPAPEPRPAIDSSDRSADVLSDVGRVGTMRGASVQFDARKLGRVALTLVMATLAVLVVVFTVAGIHSNQQIDRLHHDGVPVTVTVTGCLGLLGGSGSNAAGYTCRGTFELEGHRYTESLPGSTFYRPGTALPARAVPGDPALVSPDVIVDNQHSSASVFILPAVLLIVLLALVALVGVRARRRGGD